ncbi:J domain-containing protein, partial [Salinisphaera sp. USBA-960]|nr:J domain-containing protein [Salifodinibacter halophilus]
VNTPEARGPRFAFALAGVFGAVAALGLLLGVLVNPVTIGFAVPFGVAAYFLWHHASGRVTRDARRAADTSTRAERARADPRTRGANGFGARETRREDGGTRPNREGADRSLSEREAYEVLGLEPGAGQVAIREAYRQRVKAVHPDR